MLSFSSYFSVQYIFIFFPVVLVLYAVFPQKIRRIVLLLASFSFFWAVSGKLIIFMLLSIIGIHHAGLWISSLQKDCAHILETAQKGEKKQIKAYYQKKQRFYSGLCNSGRSFRICCGCGDDRCSAGRSGFQRNLRDRGLHRGNPGIRNRDRADV